MKSFALLICDADVVATVNRLMTVVPILIPAAIAYLVYRMQRRRTDTDLLTQLRDFDFGNLTPEETLVADSIIRHISRTDMSVETYTVLRRARDVVEALRLYPYVRRFLDAQSSDDGLRYRQSWLFYRKSLGRISANRIFVVYFAIYFTLAMIGMTVTLLGFASGANQFWMYAAFMTPLGVFLTTVGFRWLSIGMDFHRYDFAFRHAVGNLLIKPQTVA